MSSAASASDSNTIESALNLANNKSQEWSYSNGGWVLSIVTDVVNPELPDYQGVSVCVPGAFVIGIDTNSDGKADVTATSYTNAVKGVLLIDYNAKITSTNGQVYTSATAPVIINTGAAGYSAQANQTASANYVGEGYINVACGNRGKQSTATDANGKTYYTGDAPCCLCDQKAAIRYVKYNILLGNLPGSVDYFISTGGSGGGAHATMVAATSNNSDFYDYQIAAGAVGVYKLSDGIYSTKVTIKGTSYEISDGVWGCIAYSAITPLYEADMAQAFEYNLDTTYNFNTSYQEQLAKYLSTEYMEYINAKKLTAVESKVGFDINGDGDKDDTIALTIQYDATAHADTNGYYGTYLDLYRLEFESNLQWYLNNLDYTSGWTWFNADGSAMTDAQVAAMTTADKEKAFIEGCYAASTTNQGGPGGGMPGGTMPGGAMPSGGAPGGAMPSGGAPGGTPAVGTPNAGTTASSTSGTDSKNYSTFAEMASAYASDIAGVEAGDQYGNNQVDLYNPSNYIGAESTSNPTWTRIMMGGSEGDMPLCSSLNLQLEWLNAGTDCNIEWQWNGGHVPSEIFSESFTLYVDQMYAKYATASQKVSTITAKAATVQTTNGTATTATGKNISSWINSSDLSAVTFSLADVMAYRNKGASKAVPGFDVMDYGQEDYVFGNSVSDALHWDIYVNKVFQNPEYAAVLSKLFNEVKFTDVATSAWYANSVQYVKDNSIMSGTSSTTFEPDTTSSRAMVVTVLYRLAGSPAVSGTNSFTDLTQSWYANAVEWAVENGITKGASSTSFDPDSAVTREDLAAFLYRYASCKGYTLASGTDLSSFTDAGNISSYASTALAWANAAGIIIGETSTTLVPQGQSSRAVLATVLTRFCKAFAD